MGIGLDIVVTLVGEPVVIEPLELTVAAVDAIYTLNILKYPAQIVECRRHKI